MKNTILKFGAVAATALTFCGCNKPSSENVYVVVDGKTNVLSTVAEWRQREAAMDALMLTDAKRDAAKNSPNETNAHFYLGWNNSWKVVGTNLFEIAKHEKPSVN